jgi:hypothetical protein
MKKNFLFYGTLATTFITIGSAIMPITALASEIKPAISQDTTSGTKSDIQKQFNLSDDFMNSIDKTTPFTPTKEQQEKIDRLLNKHISGRIIGIDDVLELIAIAGAGYAAGHWAASEAHKRFGLSASSYKANRWWWRAGISAVAGIPAALGFDDYFYGI